jgi:hypothetical protein
VTADREDEKGKGEGEEEEGLLAGGGGGGGGGGEGAVGGGAGAGLIPARRPYPSRSAAAPVENLFGMQAGHLGITKPISLAKPTPSDVLQSQKLAQCVRSPDAPVGSLSVISVAMHTALPWLPLSSALSPSDRRSPALAQCAPRMSLVALRLRLRRLTQRQSSVFSPPALLFSDRHRAVQPDHTLLSCL